jgi:two-component system, NarL family, nitrate/nitrite response regulator NarL
VIRVMIVTEIRLRGEALAQILGQEKGIEVVGTEDEWPDCFDEVRKLEPDVVLLDMATPDGVVAAARSLTSVVPRMKVVALAVSERDVIAYAEAGVVGYVTRHASLDELKDAVERAAAGETNLSSRMAVRILEHIARLARDHRNPEVAPRLTSRELEVAELIDKGFSNKEIALRLSIEVPTVKNHVHSILKKLQVTRRSEAVARLRGRNLVDDLHPRF